MTFQITLEKDPKWDTTVLKLRTIPEDVERVIVEELISTAQFIRTRIIKAMRNTPKTGNRYRKTKNKNIYHIASSPGYAPAVDSGNLIGSIKTDVRKGLIIDDFEVEVGSILTGKKGKYPTFLEFGTKNMDARPWLEPAVDDGERELLSTIRSRIERAIKG